LLFAVLLNFFQFFPKKIIAYVEYPDPLANSLILSNRWEHFWTFFVNRHFPEFET